ncbi:MAG: bacterial Ig-like domain-containing protein, partial [Clostridia bacterium]
FKDKPSKAGYIFKNYEETYYVNEDFTISGTKLRITDKNGKTKEVEITKDMIKQMPDMTTAGEKMVVVEYEGVEYSFVITIENRTNEQLLAKLQTFLRRYESNNDSLISADIKTNLIAKYLKNDVNINEQETIELLSIMFDNDMLANTLYNTLFDALVEGSFDLDDSFVVNSNELKAKLDTLKVLENAKQSISNFDIRTYAIDLILPRTDAYYIGVISDYINQLCQINSLTGKMAVNNVVSTYYYKLKNFEHFELVDAYTQLLNKIKIHSTNTVIKQIVDDLNTKDPENILHIFSNIIEKQWLNYGHIMTSSSYALYKFQGTEPIYLAPFGMSLVNQKASVEKAIAYQFENMVKDLVNCSSLEELETIILNGLSAYNTYSTEMVKIIEIQKSNDFVLVMEQNGEINSVILGELRGSASFGEPARYTFTPYYDDEIEFYTQGSDNSKKYYDDISEYGLVDTVKRNELIEKLFKNIEYPEEDMQTSIDRIYSILNTELEDEDLYFAIADILFPNSANKYYEEIKDIVKSYLDNGIISAIEEGEIVEQLIDLIKNYPEEYKRQAIDTIYSILKEQKSGKDLYLDIVKVLTPNEDSYYIDNICNMINDYLFIDSVTGRDEVRVLVEKCFTNLKTATEFDVKTTFKEILSTIHIYSTNEMVKTATRDLENLELEEMVHIISDLAYTSQIEEIKIFEPSQAYVENAQCITTYEANQLINQYATNIKNTIRVHEDALLNIASAKDWSEVADIIKSCLKAHVDYCDGEIAFIKELQQRGWTYGSEEYHDYNGYYTLAPYLPYNHEYIVQYENDLEFLSNMKEDYQTTYDIANVLISLSLDPKSGINELLDEYKQQVVEVALEICYDYLGVEPEGYMAMDLEDLFNQAITDYLNDEFDKQEFLTDIEDVIDMYATTETKTVLNVGFMLYNALNYDESVDYNEVFKDIELPNQVESIDYNKLMSQIMSEATYDIIKYDEIEVEYITDDDGKIIAEKLTLKVDVDFDTLISSLKGDVTFTLTLDFNPEFEDDDTSIKQGFEIID